MYCISHKNDINLNNTYKMLSKMLEIDLNQDTNTVFK
jgi:hypothetical protein